MAPPTESVRKVKGSSHHPTPGQLRKTRMSVGELHDGRVKGIGQYSIYEVGAVSTRMLIFVSSTARLTLRTSYRRVRTISSRFGAVNDLGVPSSPDYTSVSR